MITVPDTFKSSRRGLQANAQQATGEDPFKRGDSTDGDGASTGPPVSREVSQNASKFLEALGANKRAGLLTPSQSTVSKNTTATQAAASIMNITTELVLPPADPLLDHNDYKHTPGGDFLSVEF